MKTVSYGSLQNGANFWYQGQEYTKVDKVKISCCKFHNAASVTDPAQRIGVADNESVEVKE